MTLEQLRIFVCVAERLHMTRAAETLGLTQSAVSAAVAALETRHQVRLFDRIGRGLALTEAGTVFLGEATSVLLRARLAEQALTDLAGLRRGTLVIAASQTIASYWLPGRIARFVERHPGVTVTLIVGNTAEVARVIAQGGADLGFVEGEVEDWALLRRPVGEDQIAVYASPGHPLVGVVIDDEALRAARWALREPGSGTRSRFEAMVAARGLAPGDLRIVLELPSNEAVLSAAADSDLVTAVSRLAAAPFVAAGRLTSLRLTLDVRQFECLVHKERRLSAAARAFVDQLEATLRPAKI